MKFIFVGVRSVGELSAAEEGGAEAGQGPSDRPTDRGGPCTAHRDHM